jgi:hypothetical protein
MTHVNILAVGVEPVLWITCGIAAAKYFVGVDDNLASAFIACYVTCRGFVIFGRASIRARVPALSRSMPRSFSRRGHPDILPRLRFPSSRYVKPHLCADVVPRNASALEIHEPEKALCVGLPLIGREMKSFNCLSVVLRDAFADDVKNSELHLSVSVSSLGQRTKEPLRSRVFLMLRSRLQSDQPLRPCQRSITR